MIARQVGEARRRFLCALVLAAAVVAWVASDVAEVRNWNVHPRVAQTASRVGASVNDGSGGESVAAAKGGNARRDAAPVIIGAGHGTTGTHQFFYTTCHLGYPSFHWTGGCLPLKIETTKMSLNRLASAIYSIIDIIIGDFNIRGGISGTLARVNAHSFIEDLLTNLERVVEVAKERNITVALHDNPHPMVVPYMIDIVKRHHVGKPPVILLSERNATEWAQRRMKHPRQIVCKNATNRISPITLRGGVFDIIGCIERGLGAMESNGGVNASKSTNASEFLYSIAEMRNSLGIEEVADHFEEHQSAMRRHAAFSYNMFEQENRTEERVLADMIRKSIGPFYPSVDVTKPIGLKRLLPRGGNLG